jgi:hypothetical protein
VAPALGSPYEGRLLSARGEQAWPGTGAGDVVAIMQIEIQPPRLDEALPSSGSLSRHSRQTPR